MWGGEREETRREKEREKEPKEREREREGARESRPCKSQERRTEISDTLIPDAVATSNRRTSVSFVSATAAFAKARVDRKPEAAGSVSSSASASAMSTCSATFAMVCTDCSGKSPDAWTRSQNAHA